MVSIETEDGMAASERIPVYVTKEDKKRIYAVAKRKGISASSLAYSCLMLEVAHREADTKPPRLPHPSDN